MEYTECFLQKEMPHFHSAISDSQFIDRFFACLLEDGIEIQYGDFISKIYENGFIKVAKSLDLYLTIGRGDFKKVLVHPKLLLIMKTTIAPPSVVAATIIDLANGVYSALPKFQFKVGVEYQNLLGSKAKKELGDFATYIMFDASRSIYKIGKSKNPFTRQQQLNSDALLSVSLIAVCPQNVESQIHFEYRDLRLFGEWFRMMEDNINDIVDKYGFDRIIHY